MPEFRAMWWLTAASAWLAVGLCLPAILLGAYRFARRPANRQTAMLLVATIAAAWLARALLMDGALLHDHNHGYSYLAVLGDRGPSTFRVAYGIGGWTLMRGLLRAFGPDPEALFAINTALSALTCVPLFQLGRALTNDDRAGLWAAWAWAWLPTAIAQAPTEDLYVLACLLGATTLAAWASWLRWERPIALWVTATAVVAAVQVRESMNMLPPILLLMTLAIRPTILRKRRKQAFIAAFACLLLALPHIAFFATWGLDHWRDKGVPYTGGWVVGALVKPLSWSNPHLDPTRTVPIVAGLALLSVVASPRRWVLAVLTGWWIVSATAALKTVTDIDKVMFHGWPGAWLCVLSGIGALNATKRWAPPQLNRRGAVAVSIALATAIALPALSARRWLNAPTDGRTEFAFLQQHQQRLRRGCTVITLTNEIDLGDDPVTIRFDWTGAQQVGVREALEVHRQTGGWPAGDDPACVLYYQSKTCFESSPDALMQHCQVRPNDATWSRLLACRDAFLKDAPSIFRDACARMREEIAAGGWQRVGQRSFASRPLNVDLLAEGEPITIGLWHHVPPERPRSDRSPP